MLHSTLASAALALSASAPALLAGGPGWDGGGPYPVYGRPADLAGSRSVADASLLIEGSDWGNARLEWLVSPRDDGRWDYRYTFRQFNPRSIGYVTLDLPRDAFFGISTNFGIDPQVVTVPTINGVSAPVLTFSLAGLDGIPSSVRFDSTAPANQLLVYEFVSTRPPVWGHIYVRGGGPPNDPIASNNARNSGWSNFNGTDPSLYVARPGRLGDLPDPGCPADFNADGLLDPDDLGDFINCSFALPPCADADFNLDGAVDPDDLGDYINAYFAGC